MKILLIDQAKKNFREQDHGRWHFIPYYLEKKGHKILHLTKKDWKKFLFSYLRFKPDVIISTAYAGIIPIFFTKIGIVKCPNVHDWNDYYSEIFSHKIGLTKASFLESFVIQYSDFITTPSKYLAEKASIYGKKAEFIQHGVELNLNLKPVKLKGKIKLLYIGEQTKYKRIDRIINAVKGLNCQLYLIGKPNKKLQEIAPKNVTFLGRIPHKEIASYIKAADICVITADQENLKMHEYAKAGKCIIAYKGRIQYFFTHMENAYITDNFKDGVKILIKDKKLRKRLEKTIKRFPTYSWQGVAKKYLGFLKVIKENERKI